MSTPIRGCAWRRRSPATAAPSAPTRCPACYDDLDQADLIVLVGSNAAWCHPVLFQRMMRNRRERGAQDRGRSIRAAPRPARTPTCSCRSRPAPTRALFCGLLVRSRRHAARSIDAYIDAHTTGFAEALGARARDRAGRRARPPRATGLDEADVAHFFELFCANARRRHLLLAGREPVGAGHRQGQRHHQLPSRHRPHRQARHGAVLAHRPAQRDGRARGRRARQPARRAHGLLRRPRSTACAASGTRRSMAEREGLKAVQMFEAIERGEIKALWVMATNPAVSLPRAGAVREALKKLELFVVSENVLSQRHRRRRRRMCCCRPPPGARRTAPSPTPSAASRASARSCRCRARRRPDWWIVSRGRAAHGLRRGVRLSHRPPTSSASTRALSAFENDGARDFDLGGARGDLATRTTTRSSRCNGRCAQASADEHARFFADGGFFTPDRKARFIAPEPPALREATSAPNSRCGSTPAACATSGTRMTRTGLSPRLGAHLPEPFVEIHPARCRARAASPTAASRRSRPRTAPACSRSWSATASSAARVRADPLERRERLVARASAIWSRRTPIRSPASPRPRRRRPPSRRSRSPIAASRCRATPLALPDGTWWARVARRRRRSASCSRPTTARWSGTTARHELLAGDAVLTEYVDRARGIYRAAAFVDGRLEGALFVGPADAPPQWERQALFDADASDGSAASLSADRRWSRIGPVVCACFGVGARRDPRSDRVAARRRTSTRSARRCAPAPIAAPACRN